MKSFIGKLIIIISLLMGLYVGGWLMFIKPIIEMCKAFDAGTLTGLMIGITAIKCIFAATVGCIIYYIGIFIVYLFTNKK